MPRERKPRLIFQGSERENGRVRAGERFQVPFSGGQGLRMVFSHPNCATAFDTQGSEPYGLLRLLKRKGYLTRIMKGRP
jgi:hypothetical protein